MSYASLEIDVVRWAEARSIVQHSTPLAQARKTLEECGELLEACATGDRAAMADAYGDILVTLIVGCATADLDLTTCLQGAYDEIKHRKGHLNKSGVFVKEVA
jgi:NTP pyrophosphatase (non-canonical NTP hydrolase)